MMTSKKWGAACAVRVDCRDLDEAGELLKLVGAWRKARRLSNQVREVWRDVTDTAQEICSPIVGR